MISKDSFAELTDRLRAGEDAAAREIFQRYTRQLIALARRRFNRVIGAKVDPEDVVQSAYKSFFRRYGGGKLEAGGWNGLWGLLTLITLRKCADRVGYYQAECRDASREVSPPQSSQARESWQEAVSREPTPLEAAMLDETVGQLLCALEEDERPILELSLQGYTVQEISRQLGRAERSVRRLRERIRKRLERLREEDSPLPDHSKSMPAAGGAEDR